jgi:hypothetical protein
MVLAGVVVATMVAALVVFRGTVPDIVKLPDTDGGLPGLRGRHRETPRRGQHAPTQMPPRGSQARTSGSTARSRALRAWPSTMAETGVLPRNSMETETTRSTSSSQVVCSSQPLWFRSFVRL